MIGPPVTILHMVSRQRHQKASDVFRAAPRLFSRPGRFHDAFPTIATLRVETQGSGFFTTPRPFGRDDGKRVYTQETAGEYIDCENPTCYNGGLNLGEHLREMLRTGATHHEWTAWCQGYEGSPKGRKRYRSCLEDWQIVVDVTYREPEAPA